MEFKDFSPSLLRFAIEIELQNTDSPDAASMIALAKLKENPEYYKNKYGYIEPMQKARITKYIKRVPKPSGKGYYYFYNQADYNHYKKTGQPPKEEKSSGLFSIIKGLFGLNSEKKAEEKITRDYISHQVQAKHNISLELWEDHLIEYFRNKEKWQAFFSKEKQEPKNPADHPQQTATKSETRGEKKPAIIKIPVMKLINDIYGNVQSKPPMSLKEKIDRASQLGKEAFQKGYNSIPKGVEFLTLIEGLPVGGGSKEIMQAYIKGWTAENLAAPEQTAKPLPAHLQAIADKHKGFEMTDVTPEGYGPEKASIPETKQKAIESLPPEKKKVVTSDNFKNWFGDWINEPEKASKVVDFNDIPEEQTPIPVYHGTARGGFKAFSKDKSQGGIYGQGFYFTEDKTIAQEYTEKDTGSEFHPYEMVSDLIDVKSQKPYIFDKKFLQRVWDSDKAGADPMGSTKGGRLSTNPNYNKYFKKLIEDTKPNQTYSLEQLIEAYQNTSVESYGGRFQQPCLNSKSAVIATILRHLKEQNMPVEQKEYPRQVYETYLNIKNPCDMNNPISEKDFKEFISEAKKIKFDPYMDDVAEFKFWDNFDKDYADPLEKFTIQDFVKIRDYLRKSRYEKDIPETKYYSGKKAGELIFPVMHLNKTENLSWGEFQYIVTNNQRFSDAGAFTNILKSMKFDGIKHTGGYNIGTADHTVWIAFEPSQIKATENSGTFDPKSEDMYKAKKLVFKKYYDESARKYKYKRIK